MSSKSKSPSTSTIAGPSVTAQLQQTASGAGQSVHRAGGSAGTMQRVSVCPCFACGEMTFGCTAPRYRHKRRSGTLLLSQCMSCVVVTLWVLKREVLLIVVLVMSIQPVRLAIREGTGREVTSNPLPFVNAPPEGCVWEQWGDLGVDEGMWEVETGVSEIEVPKVGVKGRLRQCLPFWREVVNASPAVLSMAVLPLLAEPPPLNCR